MAITHSLFNKRENIMEPNLQKHRLIYKGPVSSATLNLVNDQFLLDINRLSEKINNLNNKILQISNMTGNNMYAKDHDYYLNNELKMTIRGQKITYNESSEDYSVIETILADSISLTFDKFQKNSSLISWLSHKLDIIEDAIQKDS